MQQAITVTDLGAPIDTSVTQSLVYDATSHSLLSASGSTVTRYPLSSQHIAQVTHVVEGAPIQKLRAAPDGTLAVQRSLRQVEVYDPRTGTMFVLASQGRESILGFHWTKAAASDFVLVTPGAVELYQRSPQGLRLLEHRRHESSEAPLYSHATRVLLLRNGSWFQGFQLGPQLMKLPPFQLSAEGELRSSGAAAAALADMGLLALYGRVYCYLRCRNAAVVKLYRFYKGTVELEHTFSMPAYDVQLCVVDNVVVALHPTSGSAMLLDVCSTPSDRLEAATHPVDLNLALPSWAGLQWSAALPNLLLDRANGRAGQLQLHLPAVAAACVSRAACCGFLLRRRVLGGLSGADNLAHIVIGLLKSMLMEHAPMDEVSAAWRALHRAQVAGWAPDALIEGVTSLLLWLNADQVVDALYIQAALAELVYSAELHGVVVAPQLKGLWLEVLLLQGSGSHQLAQLQALQPSACAAL